VFERFTPRARQAVVLAQDEARRLGHDYIGTEHVLLGLLGESDGVAALALRRLGVRLDTVRSDVERLIGRGTESPSGHIPFTPRSKKVLELSLREALGLGHNYIGTEHILLGLLREGEGVAAHVLVTQGVPLERARDAVIEQLESRSPRQQGGRATPRRTPAGDQAIALADELSALAPTGSHHLLEALARAEDSLAAKVLVAFGVDADALAAKIDELGVEGTTDVTPEEVAARLAEVRLEGDEVHVVLRDGVTVELARAVVDTSGRPVKGDDPLLTGAFIELWQSTLSALEEVKRRLTPSEAEQSKPPTRSALVQRAIQSRLRRRRSGTS
jgi:ATP-dependent Clp protease ATP-binding subunit ClpA